MTNSMELFGEKIKKLRKKMDMTQYEASEKLNISPNHLSSLENGKSNPSYDLICRLCDTFDTNPDYLFLGSMHSNSLSKDVTDKLHLLSEGNLILISKIIDLFIEEQH